MELHDLFFKAATEAIYREDSDLRSLFERNGDTYENLHHGIGILFETTYVFTIYKKLLYDRFPHKVLWECPYPTQNSLKADLAFSNADEDGDDMPSTLIEVKLWGKGQDITGIVGDIKKLNASAAKNKWLFIICLDRHNKEQDIESIRKEVSNLPNSALQLLNAMTLQSKWHEDAKHKLIDVDILLFNMSGQI